MAFMSEVNFLGGSGVAGGEFVEIAINVSDNPADYVVSVYRDDGTLHTGAGIAGGEVNLSTLTGVTDPDNPNWIIYTIPVGIKDNISDADEGSAIALTDITAGTVLDFYGTDNFTVTATEGAANGALSDPLPDWRSIGWGNSFQQDWDGTTHVDAITNDDAVICVSGDCLVRCAEGDLRADTLKVGDKVWTLDRGYQPIRWIGNGRVGPRALRQSPAKHPVRIKAGALNGVLPERDLLVSQQHRLLVRSRVCERLFGQSEVLVAAKKLCGFDGIGIADDVEQLTYVHIAFDHHEVFLANGAPVESLLLGAEAVKTLGDAVDEVEWLRDRVSGLVPVAKTPARPVVERKMLKRLLCRLQKNRLDLLEEPVTGAAKTALAS